MTMQDGYSGKIAIVDLTLGKVTYDSLLEDDPRKFVGGRGFGTRELWNRRNVSFAQPFCMFVGPLTGTGIPLANRLTMVFRSPLTGTIAYANTGGYAGTALKLSGFDGLVLLGDSPKPVYLFVKKGDVSICDASGLRGKKAVDSVNALRQKHGDARVLSIGPAGENLVKYANVVNDAGRASGVRHGAGCVLGQKKVKAVAILSDYSERVSISNRVLFKNVLARLSSKLRASPLLNRETGSFSVYGTPLAVEPLNSNEAHLP